MTSIEQEALFAPFEKWGDGYYGLQVQDGMVTTCPAEGRDSVEYHLECQGGGIWALSAHQVDGVITESAGTLYRGKIPNREFFLALMANIEGAPPLPAA